MKLKIRSLTTALAILTSLGTNAEILTVDNRPGAVAMFSDFTAAHEAAATGDTILIAGSPKNYGSVSVSKVIRLAGPGLASFFEFTEGELHPATFGAIIAEPGSDGLILSGLGISTLNVNSSRISVQDCQGATTAHEGFSTTLSVAGEFSFERCFVSSMRYRSQVIVEMQNCVVGHNRDVQGLSTTLRNCVVTMVASGNLTFLPVESNWVLIDSIVVESALPAAQNIQNTIRIEEASLENIFRTDLDGLARWQLRRDVAENLATGATIEADLGAFGGLIPLTLGGPPTRPRIKQLSVSDIVTPTSGLRIQLEAVAGNAE